MINLSDLTDLQKAKELLNGYIPQYTWHVLPQPEELGEGWLIEIREASGRYDPVCWLIHENGMWRIEAGGIGGEAIDLFPNGGVMWTSPNIEHEGDITSAGCSSTRVFVGEPA